MEENNKITFEAVFSGVDIAQRPNLYLPLINQKQQIQKRAKDLNELYQYNDKQLVKGVLAQYPKANAWLPLKANAVDMVVLVNKESASIIKIVDLRPWE